MNLMLTRVKKMWDKENKCPENCACEECRRDNEFVIRARNISMVY